VNALAQPRGFLLLIVDQSGPIGSTQMPSSWRHLEQATVEQLVKASNPGRTVLSVKWAEQPKLYTCSGDVLVVEVPGTRLCRELTTAEALEQAWFDELASIEAEERDAEEERQRDCMLTAAEELR
jgi:hypothetical protein